MQPCFIEIEVVLFLSLLNCSTIKRSHQFCSLVSSATMRRMNKILCLFYTLMLYICRQLLQNGQRWVLRGNVSRLNTFTRFRRITDAISCIDIIWYYTYFLKKSHWNFLIPQFIGSPFINFQLFFSPSSPCLLAPLPFYFGLESSQRVPKT